MKRVTVSALALNPYPNAIFTVLIWGADRAKFGQPEVELKGKRICVTGKIEDFKGTAQIVAKEKGQITVEWAG